MARKLPEASDESEELAAAKSHYAACVKAVLALSDTPLSAKTVSEYWDPSKRDTVFNYMSGARAPQSDTSHDLFVDALRKTLAAKGRIRFSEFEAEAKKLDIAYVKVEKARRLRKSKLAPRADPHRPPAALEAPQPAVPAPAVTSAATEERVHRVLVEHFQDIVALIDSADFFGMQAQLYFERIGVKAENWIGPPNWMDRHRSEATDPRFLAPRGKWNSFAYQDCFTAVTEAASTFNEEFAATPELASALSLVLVTSESLDRQLTAYWQLAGPCIEYPHHEPDEKEVLRRKMAYEPFPEMDLHHLSRHPPFTVRVKELALLADRCADELRDAAKSLARAWRREVVRRGLQPPQDPTSV